MITGPARVWDPTDPALVREIAARVGGESYADLSAEFGGIPKDTLRAAVRRARARGLLDTAADASAAPTPAGGGVTWTGAADGRATVESAKGGRVKTLDGLLSACEVDLTRWEVERFVVNKWETVMRGADGSPLTSDLFQVKAWLRPIPGVGAAQALIAGLIADLADRAPLPSPVSYPVIPDNSDRHMLELDPFDLHVGMLSWSAETGADYDSSIAVDLATRAFERLIQLSAGFQFERVLIPLGHDFVHSDRQIDGKGGVTTRGTQQDVDTRRGKMVKTAIDLAIRLIEMARQVAPVDVVICPGNHDQETMPMLGEVLVAWFRNDPDVTIVNDPAPRQYVRYGASLIGLTHGHDGKAADLPLIMATERPDFGEATFKLWRCGHLHRRGETISEHSGVRVCVAPSLAARDHWHALQGYGHMRAMEAHVWHREYGPVGQFTASVPGILRAAA